MGWWLNRMATGSSPLQEKLTLFWHGHFTTSARDERSAMLMWRQNELLRRYAAGSFEPFLRAISRDPAMLDYLNNNENRKAHPNENYAREVMELFTLGIGNYTEDDVKQGAAPSPAGHMTARNSSTTDPSTTTARKHFWATPATSMAMTSSASSSNSPPVPISLPANFSNISLTTTPTKSSPSAGRNSLRQRILDSPHGPHDPDEQSLLRPAIRSRRLNRRSNWSSEPSACSICPCHHNPRLAGR